jgi:hypothetical protein
MDAHSDIDSWLEEFEIVMSKDPYEDPHALLRMNLKGRALEVYRQMPSEMRCNLTSIKDKLRSVFSKHGRADYWDEKLKTCKLQPEESLDSYAQRVQSLVFRRYPHVLDATSHTISAFIDGLPDDIQYDVKCRYPSKLDYAIKRARIESALAKRPSKIKRLNHIQTNEETELNELTVDKKIRCYNCNQLGHVRTNCPQNKEKTLSFKQVKLCYRCRSDKHLIRDCKELGTFDKANKTFSMNQGN